jgi:hypothetical protein
MIKVQVNTTMLKTELRSTLMEAETVRDLVSKIGIKVGENFMNERLFVVLPVFKSSP